MKIFAFPDEFIAQGSVEELYKEYGLDTVTMEEKY